MARFDPRGKNPYFEGVMNLLGRMSMSEYQQKQKLEQQNKIGQVMEAREAVGGAATGGEMGPTPAYLKARGTLQKLEPEYGGAAFLKSRQRTSVYDPETGEIRYTVPKGSKRGIVSKKPKLRIPTKSGVQTTATVEGKGIVPVRPYTIAGKQQDYNKMGLRELGNVLNDPKIDPGSATYRGAEKEYKSKINTQKVILKIETQDDLDELLENEAYYREKGVDIEAVIKAASKRI